MTSSHTDSLTHGNRNWSRYAIETADLTLVSGDISKIADVIELSGATLRIIKQNLFWALGYNTIAIPMAALGTSLTQ